MVRDISKAKDAQDVNELIAWANKGGNKYDKKARFLVARSFDFYWSSFKSDQELNEAESILSI